MTSCRFCLCHFGRSLESFNSLKLFMSSANMLCCIFRTCAPGPNRESHPQVRKYFIHMLHQQFTSRFFLGNLNI